MFAVRSFENEPPELPLREKLLGLFPSEIRQQCEFVGLDARSADSKGKIAAILYNFRDTTVVEGFSVSGKNKNRWIKMTDRKMKRLPRSMPFFKKFFFSSSNEKQ